MNGSRSLVTVFALWRARRNLTHTHGRTHTKVRGGMNGSRSVLGAVSTDRSMSYDQFTGPKDLRTLRCKREAEREERERREKEGERPGVRVFARACVRVCVGCCSVLFKGNGSHHVLHQIENSGTGTPLASSPLIWGQAKHVRLTFVVLCDSCSSAVISSWLYLRKL